MCEVKYLPSSFDGVVIFVLRSLPDGIPTSYGNEMYKNGQNFQWSFLVHYQGKKSTQNNVGLIFCISTSPVIFNAPTFFVTIFIAMLVFRIVASGLDPLLNHFFVGSVVLDKSKLE